MHASDPATPLPPSLPPDFEKWFWTTRFAKFALFGGVSLGLVIGALIVLFHPILAWVAQKGEGVIDLGQVLWDALFGSLKGAMWTALLLLPVTVPLGLLLDWIELRRMRDAEQAVKDIQNSRFQGSDAIVAARKEGRS
jgi:ABC-type Fe3+ transport system permease subunit